MGKSKSIEQMQKENTKFQDFIKDMRKDLDEQAAAQQKKIDDMVAAYHKDYDDEVMVLSGNFTHQSVVSEWSLDAVNKMIDSCRNAILGDAPPPPGVTAGSEAKQVATAMSQIGSVNTIIANAAFNVVQSLLRSVGSRTSVETKASQQSVPLAPGIRLFIAVVENSYDKTSFFGSDSIMQTLFVFTARYSLKEGKKQNEMAGLQGLSDLAAAYVSQLKQLSTEIAKLDIMDPEYFERMDRLERIQARIKLYLNKIDDEIAKLGGATPDRAQLLNAVDNVVRTTRRLQHNLASLPAL